MSLSFCFLCVSAAALCRPPANENFSPFFAFLAKTRTKPPFGTYSSSLPAPKRNICYFPVYFRSYRIDSHIHISLCRTPPWTNLFRPQFAIIMGCTILQITEQLKFPTLWKRFPTFLVGNLFQRVGNLFVVPLYCSYVRERVGNLFVVPL